MTATCRLLVLGASAAVRASLRAARRDGFHVIAADGASAAGAMHEADESLVLSIDNVDAVVAAARALRVQGIIATTDHAVVPAATAATTLGLPGIDPDTARRATSKAAMRAQWERAGIPGPRTRTASTDSDITIAAEQLGYPVVVKPANALGGGSRGVSMAHNRDELAEAVHFARAYSSDGVLLIEQCVEARSEHSLEILFVEGNAAVLAIGDKVKSAPPYRVDLQVRYPTALPEQVQEIVGDTAIRAARSLGIEHGMAHVELAWTSDGVMLFELGARCGGGATAAPLVPWATGIDEFVAASRVACGLPTGSLLPTRNRGGCYRFLTPTPGALVRWSTLATMRSMPGVLEADLWVADGAVATAIRTGRDRVGAVVAGAETCEDAVERADKAAAVVEMTTGFAVR